MKQELDTTDTHKSTINEFLSTMYHNGEIDFSGYDCLLNIECRIPILYLFPKIHKGKMPPLGRPIISAVGSHTEKTWQFVDHFRNPVHKESLLALEIWPISSLTRRGQNPSSKHMFLHFTQWSLTYQAFMQPKKLSMNSDITPSSNPAITLWSNSLNLFWPKIISHSMDNTTYK